MESFPIQPATYTTQHLVTMSLFITFEGPDGSGKSTQARRLYERIAGAGYPVILTREPGGTPISELIRRIVLDLQHGEMHPTTEALLFSAARAQHVAQRIRPYLDVGGIVICDRFADATYAYQGYGLGRDLDELQALTQIATGGLMPQATILIDVPVEVGLERKQVGARSGTTSPLSPRTPVQSVEWNRLDAREVVFHERVRAGYRALAEAEPQRWFVLDGREPMDTLAAAIWQHLQPHVLEITPLERRS